MEISVINYCPICRATEIDYSQSVLSPFFAYRTLGIKSLRILDGEFDDLQAGESYFPTSTMYCHSCSSVCCNIRFDGETMNRYYTNYQGDEFIEQRVKFEPSFRSRLLQRSNNNYFRLRGESITYTNVINDLIKEFVKFTDIKVLDFGGGTGSNSPFRGDAVIDLIELGDEDETRNLRSYDVVSILNVLEHVMDPIDVLRRAGGFAKQRSGLVAIEVPFESFMQEQNLSVGVKKKIWTEHVNCFSKKGLEKCMNLAGLEIIKEVSLINTGHASKEIRENNAALFAIGSPSS